MKRTRKPRPKKGEIGYVKRASGTPGTGKYIRKTDRLSRTSEQVQEEHRRHGPAAVQVFEENGRDIARLTLQQIKQVGMFCYSTRIASIAKDNAVAELTSLMMEHGHPAPVTATDAADDGTPTNLTPVAFAWPVSPLTDPGTGLDAQTSWNAYATAGSSTGIGGIHILPPGSPCFALPEPIAQSPAPEPIVQLLAPEPINEPFNLESIMYTAAKPPPLKQELDFLDYSYLVEICTGCALTEGEMRSCSCGHSYAHSACRLECARCM